MRDLNMAPTMMPSTFWAVDLLSTVVKLFPNPALSGMQIHMLKAMFPLIFMMERSKEVSADTQEMLKGCRKYRIRIKHTSDVIISMKIWQYMNHSLFHSLYYDTTNCIYGAFWIKGKEVSF
jgi:hypothetical protein